jgi:hypothetical protein
MNMKFRKKPVIIEAEQFNVFSSRSMRGVCGYGGRCKSGTPSTELHVHTIHDNQIIMIEHRDWIIPESDGVHFYPCKPDIFAETYEPIED